MNQLIGANDAMVYKGGIDCSANPNYPAGQVGWTWKVTAAGKIGGAHPLKPVTQSFVQKQMVVEQRQR